MTRSLAPGWPRAGRRCVRAMLAVLGVSSLGLACAPMMRRAGDADEIRAAHRQFISAVNAGDLDRAFAFLTSDFVAMPECSPDRTKAQFRAGLASFGERFTPAYEFDTEELILAGDWAFERIRYWGTITPKPTGAPQRTSWRALAVWRRERGAGWRVARYIRTPDAGSGAHC